MVQMGNGEGPVPVPRRGLIQRPEKGLRDVGSFDSSTLSDHLLIRGALKYSVKGALGDGGKPLALTFLHVEPIHGCRLFGYRGGVMVLHKRIEQLLRFGVRTWRPVASGGHPIEQAKIAASILRFCSRAGLHPALHTPRRDRYRSSPFVGQDLSQASLSGPFGLRCSVDKDTAYLL